MKMNFRAVRQFLSMGLLAGVAMACGLGLGSAARSADIAGSGDHPLVGRYDGAEIVGYRVTEFDETAIGEGAFAPEHATDRTGNGFRTRQDLPDLLQVAPGPLHARGLAQLSGQSEG